MVFVDAWRQVIAPLLEALRKVRPQAGGVEVARDLAICVKAKALKRKDFLHGDDLALHAGDFGDRDHAPRAVLQAAGLNDQVHG